MADIIHYSDFEGALDIPEKVASLSSFIQKNRENGDTLITGGGDNFGPSVLSLCTDCENVKRFFELIEPDIATLGNHDFDYGVDTTREVIQSSPQKWVCANVYSSNGRFAANSGLTPWATESVGDTVLGVIGVAHPHTSNGNPEAVDLRFSSPVDAVETCLDELRISDLDSITVISHLGDEGEETVSDVASIDGVDLVLDGHKSKPVVDYYSDTLVCRPGANGDYVVEVTLEDSPQGELVELGEQDSSAFVEEEVRRWKSEAGLLEEIGEVESPIQCNRAATRGGESRIGNLVTDAYRWRSSADVGIQFPGGIRDRSPIIGSVFVEDIVGVVPFKDELVKLELSGDELMQVFAELSLVPSPLDAPRWQFGHVSGCSLVWDDNRSRVLEASVQGCRVKSDEMYTVATSAYYVDTDQMSTVLEPELVVDRYGPQYESLVKYVREHGVSPAVENRIERLELR